MTSATTPSALIVVDVQNDFCEGGSLQINGGIALAVAINEYLQAHADDYAAVVTTQDWHIDPGTHFSPEPDFVKSWPVHCVAGTEGAELRPELDQSTIDARFYKGEFSDGYSGFEGRQANDDNLREPVAAEGSSLAEWLHEREIKHLDVVGMATDYCLSATAGDGPENGFETTVLTGLIAGVDVKASRAKLVQLAEMGIVIQKS